MDIVIGGKLLRGDLIVSACLRSDLTPVPQSLEATLRDAEETQVKVGDVIQSGRDNASYRIVKVQRGRNVQAEQDGLPYGTVSFIALLDACADISFTRRTAVIKTNATLGAIYRACGARVQIESDFTVRNYACFVGDVPSFGIARALQEEGGVVFWTGQRLRFMRLPDLFKQRPAKTLPQDTTRAIASDFLQRHEIPFFYSIDDDGVVIFGNRTQARAASYTPRQDARTLTNMTRVLVMRSEFTSPYAPAINAGAVIQVVDKPYVVVTAAHVVETGTDGSSSNTYSKFWLGGLE